MRLTTRMTDALPAWPPDWIEDRELAAEQVVAVSGDVSLASALRSDDRVLISVSWPGGRRYMLVDPVGNDAPQALRAGEIAEDVEISRGVDALWSQALEIAKRLIDGDLDLGAMEQQAAAEQDTPRRRRPWRRGEG